MTTLGRALHQIPAETDRTAFSTVWKAAAVVSIFCAVPALLMTTGVDFGTSGRSLTAASARSMTTGELGEAAHAALRGSYTHTLLEWTAVCAAAMVGLLTLIQYRLTREAAFPIIGIALLCAGAMDAFHTFAADRLIDTIADNRDLITFTWAIGRFFSGSILLLGVGIIVVCSVRRLRLPQVAIVAISVGFAAASYLIVRYCATSAVLPQTSFPEAVIKRPFDIYPLIPMLLCGLVVFPIYFRRTRSVFAAALLLSVIPQVAAQLYMAFGSVGLHDSAFNIAHGMKVVAYLLPLLGLSLEYIEIYRRHKDSARFLARRAAEADLLRRLVNVPAGCESVRGRLQQSVELICRSFQWCAGSAYLVNEGGSTGLIPVGFQLADESTVDDGLFPASGRPSERIAAELAGVILESGQSAARDLTLPGGGCVPLSENGRNCVHSAIGFPVSTPEGIVAVLVFFSEEPIEHDAESRRFCERLSHQLSGVIERARAKEAVREAMKKLELQRFALDEHAIVSITDADGIITYANDRFCDISGYSREELIGQNHSLIQSGEHDEAFYDEMWNTISRGDVWRSHVRNKTKNGATYWVNATIVPCRNSAGRITQYIAIRTDITKHKRDEERLRITAQTDDLTGLPNRMLLLERISSALERAKRDPDYRFAVLFLDFDRFKVVNDSLGHDVGDLLLMGIASRLCKNLRIGDTCAVGDDGNLAARIGGDEFVVLLDGLSHANDAARVAQRLLDVLGKPHLLGLHEVVSTASIGIVISEPRYRAADEVLRDADNAMYAAKSAGRACYAIFDRQMHEAALDGLRLEGELRDALAKQEFSLRYQPIVDLRTGELKGFEALVRWEHPVRGVQGPDQWLSVAEEIGVIIEMGRYVFETAAHQLKTWQVRFPEYEDLFVNVNVSKKQLIHSEFITDVQRIITESDVDRGTLKIEITESRVVNDMAAIEPTIESLGAMGIPLCMDDFGTGTSSLAILHDLPVEVLKIDRAFINNLSRDRQFSAILQAIVTLAHNLDMIVVAEGIETPEQMVQLQTLDCDQGQGYLFAKPLLAADAEEMLRKWPDRKLSA